MYQTLKKLYSVKLLSFKGIFKLLVSVVYEGSNLMTLIRYAANMFPEHDAIVDNNGNTCYHDLYVKSYQLACQLQKTYKIEEGVKVGVACRNHVEFVVTLIALSRLGADVYLLTADISQSQYQCLSRQHCFSLLVCDPDNYSNFNNVDYSKHILLSCPLPAKPEINSIDSLCAKKLLSRLKLKRTAKGKIIVLTGGTSGKLKIAERSPSILIFIKPFFALLNKLNLDKYKSVYIATSLSHGFGLAAYLVSTVLGSKVRLTQKFNSRYFAGIVDREQIEVLVLVPGMLHQLLEQSDIKLCSIQCVLSGAATLSPALLERTLNRFGPVLSNLYGTSEAGFSIIAVPEDLKRNPQSIGKKIPGIKLKVLDEYNRELPVGQIGSLCISSGWSMTNWKEYRTSIDTNKLPDSWINTGDLAYVDNDGYYYLNGRADDMIVSGGINVYPIELENILITHNDISDVAVVGVQDECFGQRLRAYVVAKALPKPSEIELQQWLIERTARHQRPLSIEFLESIPLTHIGKVDKRYLGSYIM